MFSKALEKNMILEGNVDINTHTHTYTQTEGGQEVRRKRLFKKEK